MGPGIWNHFHLTTVIILLNAYSVPGKVLGTRNVSINEIDMISVVMKLVF